MTRRVVVVGAGAAGAPLAARLSEDPDIDVTVLEAGAVPARRADFPPELLDASTVQGAMPGHPANWSYLGHLTDDLPYTIARGRIIGGSSTINGAYFVRATPADFARWAAVGGDDWGYARMLPACARSSATSTSGRGRCTATRGRCRCGAPPRGIRPPRPSPLPRRSWDSRASPTRTRAGRRGSVPCR
ncbi:hypothetical protein GCM10025877_11650 [Agromyces mangrovi Wang et al. 2018]|nr:hypothetical protein GCM10025877_11650 [Agromyces mangrovi]